MNLLCVWQGFKCIKTVFIDVDAQSLHGVVVISAI